ncbi:MAG: hypothetical protein R3D25_13220 [Geminicoccaceae bacterium]
MPPDVARIELALASRADLRGRGPRLRFTIGRRVTGGGRPERAVSWLAATALLQ